MITLNSNHNDCYEVIYTSINYAWQSKQLIQLSHLPQDDFKRWYNDILMLYYIKL